MKKTLFISDLDGTLLNAQANLPAEAARRINRLTGQGVMITYATARTVRSVSSILGEIDFTLPGACPAALMNGVLVRDMKTGEYIRAAVLDRDKAQAVLDAVTAGGDAEPFIYALDRDTPIAGDPLITCWKRLANDAMRAFMDERIERFGKPFVHIGSLGDVPGEIVYFAVIGSKEAVTAAAERVGGIAGTKYACYRDAYSPSVWYLEVFDESASKKNAAEFLRTITGADELVCFGDNHNDLPMFEAADVSVAVENAVGEVKAAADSVTDDVVKFIEEYLQ
ncbi:MAG: HAD family phosphatase [Clostridia bacterium]|nr:HAD family phosphatase [Clostridia bacterium]